MKLTNMSHSSSVPKDDDLLGQVHLGIALQKHFYWAEKYVQNSEKFNYWLYFLP